MNEVGMVWNYPLNQTDYDAILETILHRYIDGCNEHDAKKLGSAFHKDAWILLFDQEVSSGIGTSMTKRLQGGLKMKEMILFNREFYRYARWVISQMFSSPLAIDGWTCTTSLKSTASGRSPTRPPPLAA